MKRLYTCLFQYISLDQISFETKQKSKCEVDFNFIFISLEKKLFWNYPNFFWKKSGNQYKFYSTRAKLYLKVRSL